MPAAVAAARALFRQNELRKGTKLLETIWKKNPHPEIAEIYVHARPGDSVLDRLTRARRLQSIKQNHPESAFAVARASLDAGEYKEAREAAEQVIRQEPREGAYLLMADIEEAETGDQGRLRHWLGKAVKAPRDPAWVADGYVSEHWAPVSPVTGRLDAFEWRAPVERLGELIEQEDELPELPPPPAAAPVVPEPAQKAAEKQAMEEVVEAQTLPVREPEPKPAQPAEVAAAAKAMEPPEQPVAPVEKPAQAVPAKEVRPELKPAPKAEPRPEPVKKPEVKAEPAKKPAAAGSVPVDPKPARQDRATEAPRRPPDDPGPDGDSDDGKEPAQAGRFKLF